MLRTFFPKKKHVVYLEDGLLFCNLPHNRPPSLPGVVLDMPEEIQECLLAAVKRVLLRVGCAEIYFCNNRNYSHRFFLGGKNGSKQKRDGAKTYLDFFGGDEPGPAGLFQIHELLHRECQCSHEGNGVGKQHSVDKVGASNRNFVLHV